MASKTFNIKCNVEYTFDEVRCASVEQRIAIWETCMWDKKQCVYKIQIKIQYKANSIKVVFPKA